MADPPGRVLIIGGDQGSASLAFSRLSRASSALANATRQPLGEKGLDALGSPEWKVALVVQEGQDDETLEFLRAVAALDTGVPLVLLSTDGEPDFIRRAHDAGAVECLPLAYTGPLELDRVIRYVRAQSDWRRAEEVEREERVRFQATLLSAVGQAVIATDLEGGVVYWNRSAERLYGWTADEALGRRIVDLTTPIEAKPRAEEIMETLRAEGQWAGEFEVRRKDGSTFLAYVHNSPVFDPDGRLVGLIGASSDITSRRATERDLEERVQQLQTLYRTSRIMNQGALPLANRLERVVEELPAGWPHPDGTVARISLRDLVVEGDGFRETPWMQSETIVSDGRSIGSVEVFLTEERPAHDEGIFLTEERQLLAQAAQTIGVAVERDRLTRLLSRTIASLEEAVIILEPDEDGPTVREVNPATERIFGYSREELVGDVSGLSRLFADDRTYRRFRASCVPALARTGVFHGTVPMRRKGGESFPAEQTVTLLDPEGGVEVGQVLTIRDISLRRRAEERFGVLSREIMDHIYVVGPGMDVRYSTPSVEELTGLTREEFEGLDGESLLAIVHPEDRGRVRDAMASIAGTPEGVKTGQYRIVRTDGEIRHVEAIVRNLLDNPVLGGLVITTRDVTKRVELENQLRQGQKMEAVGRLAGGIAHDFNNILTVIRSQTDLLLLDPPNPDDLAREMEVIQSSVQRAATLTGQLLAFSRDQILHPQTIDVSRVVRATGEMVDRIIGEDITIEYDLPEDLPLLVEVDPGQLEQAVLNLAVNARDAMPNGGTLSLAAYREYEIRHPEEESTSPAEVRRTVSTVLRVSDTGGGMDAETRARIFEPFYTTKSRGKGTGLGLAMVYGFVEQSGGTIAVESYPGEGTTFFLAFPAASGPTTDPAPEIPQTPGEISLAGTVLLVEDDPAVQRATQRILEGAGMEVVAVGDAESGLERVESGTDLDMVLTDLVLPGMNGRELVTRIRATRPELPVLVMSGYAEGPSGQELNLPPDVGFVQKPFTREDLARAVEQTLTESPS